MIKEVVLMSEYIDDENVGEEGVEIASSLSDVGK